DHSDGFSAHSLPSFMTYASTADTFCIFYSTSKQNAFGDGTLGQSGRPYCDGRHQIHDCLGGATLRPGIR
ncbi:MAG: hypothetical protein WAR02_22325, partial [Pseudolabrys sp.]